MIGVGGVAPDRGVGGGGVGGAGIVILGGLGP